jgi:hypothetical protein
MNNWDVPDRIRTIGFAVTEDGFILPALSVAAVECRKLGY